jgi:hypothetical protein
MRLGDGVMNRITQNTRIQIDKILNPIAVREPLKKDYKNEFQPNQSTQRSPTIKLIHLTFTIGQKIKGPLYVCFVYKGYPNVFNKK